MTYLATSQDRLEYFPCRYQGSRVLFRGPRRSLDGDYIACLGGTETYGRFIEAPFPSLLERRLSVACVNFGVVNAGVDLYLNDPAVLDLASKASAKVLQIGGAQNLSNRFYSVHPRRNDRFLRASERLMSLYPEVDFTEFHFTRHLLGHLRAVSEDRFHALAEELQLAWIARMKHLLTQLRGRTILLWFADQPPPGDGAPTMGAGPMFVTQAMIETLRPRVAAVVIVCPSHEAQIDATSGMVFSDYDACAAAELPGALAHHEVARALEAALAPLLDT